MSLVRSLAKLRRSRPPWPNTRNLHCMPEHASISFKVHVFYEGHKNWRNLHRRFDTYSLLHNVKLTVKISSIFLASLENMNFNSRNFANYNERFRDKISPQCKNSMCIFLQQSGAIRKPLIPTKFEKFLEYFCISMKK